MAKAIYLFKGKVAGLNYRRGHGIKVILSLFAQMV
jgi:hypothetical protein